MVDIQSLLQTSSDLIIGYIPKILLAIITLVVGLWIIKWILKAMNTGFKKRMVDPTISQFVTNIGRVLLKVVLFISVIGILGVQTSSFVAILAAMGLAVGLALQGSLSNFAGGVLIIMFKPFIKGEYIQAQGENGTVDSIAIFTTTLKTPDNKTIIIPNGPLANGNITNFSRETTRRVDFVFGVAYSDDIKKAQKILHNVVSKHEKTLKDPEPLVRVKELADSSVNFAVRVWVNREDYWDVYYDVIESVKAEFDKKGISIPFPQTDVYIHKS